MMNLLQVIILSFFLWTEQVFQSTSSIPPHSPPTVHDLSSLLTTRLEPESNEPQDGTFMMLQNGVFQGQNIMLVSTQLELRGMNSIVEFCPSTNQNDVVNKQANRNKPDASQRCPSIFVVQNCSLSLHSLTLSSGNGETSITSLDRSELVVSSCEIISSPSTSPFMIVPSTHDSWATIRIELSTHRNLESHMLVPFCDVLPNTEIPLETVKTEEGSGSVSIVGTGLSLNDHSLSTSTGPLFTFRQSTSASHTLPAHTYLLHSGLSNVTSSGMTDIGLVSPLSSQTLSASDMSHVTNHFDGTALLDINRGATVLCVNSSVSHSVSDRRANADVTHTIQDKHLTTRTDSSTLPSETTILSILRCTFIVSSAEYGGAFKVSVYNVDKVTVTSCNFHKCISNRVEGSDKSDGGALHLSGRMNTDTTTLKRLIAQVDKCVFSECFAVDAGGAVLIGRTEGTITNCYFDKCAADRASAIFAEDAKLTGSNNYIIGCVGNVSGPVFVNGWKELILDVSPKISKFYFRDNVRNISTTKGRDVYVGNMHNYPLTPEKITDCDTSSDYLGIHISNPDTDSASIPQVSRATHIVTSSMAMESSTATFTVTCAHAMTGTMAVLLDGDTLPRLIFVTFSNAITGTGTATVGAGGVLPSGKTYTLRSAVMPGWGLGMYIVSAVANTKDANTTTIEVTGFGLKEGSFWVLATNGDDEVNVTMTLTPSSSTTLTGDATLYPFGSSGQLKYDTEYTVKDVFFVNGLDEMNLVVNRPVTFKTPIEPARIETVSAGLNGKKDTIMVSMEGRKLHNKKQNVVIRRVGSSTTWSAEIFNVSESGCLVNFTVGDEETASSLKFGETYEIDSVGQGVDSFYVNPGRSFFVPLPPRIATLSFASGEITTNMTVLTVEGTSLPNEKTYRATTTSSHTFPIEFSSDTLGTSTIFLGWADEMKYGTQYTISSVKLSEEGKDDEFILLDSCEFTTPLGPSVSAIGCDFDSSTLNNVVLTVTSSGMSGESFTVQVSEKRDASNILSFSMTFSSTSGSKNVAVYKQTGTLEYGKEYELVKVFSLSVNAVIPSPALVLKVPAAPSRIIKAKCELGGTNETDALITLEGLFLPGGKSFSIMLFKLVSDVRTGDGFTLTGTISGTGNQTSTQLTETLYPSHANLSFGTDYEITALTIAETKTIVEETAKFSIPAEPSRIVGLKNTPNVDGNRTEIVVVGRWMDAGDYTVTLSPSASFTIRFEGTKTEERESKPTTLWLYGSTVDLSFDVSYTLVSVVKATPDAPEIFIDQPIAPFTIAGKTRLTEMRLESYSLDRKKADFVMTGLLLSTSKIYEVELKSASSSRWIAMKVDGSEWKGEAVLYPSADATLKYGDSYWINSFREQGTTVELLHDTLEVIEIIPEPPRLLSCSAEPAIGLNTTTLTLTTHALTSGANYSLTLRGSKLDVNDETSNNENSDVIITFLGQKTISQVLTLYPLNDADVEYGMNYSIISLSTKGETQPVLIEPIASSFRTPIEPARIETVSAGLNGKKDTAILTMSGRRLYDKQQKVVIGRVGSSMTWSAEIFNVSESGCLVNFTVGDDETDSSLKFGETYEIVSVGEGDDSFYVNPGRSFLVPLPPRIATLSFASGEITTNRTVLTVGGTSLPNGKTYRATTTSSHTFPIEFSSDTLGTSTIFLGWADEMKYGTQYTISSVKLSEEGKDDEFILLDSSEFTTPSGPSVSAIGCDFDSSTLNNVVLTVTSSGMNGEEFTVQVSEKQDASNILSFSMTFSSTSGSKNVAVYKQTGTLEYGKEYELVKVFSLSVNAVIPSPALVLKVPAAPSRIIKAKCELGGTNETDALITLEGLFLPGGKSFSITLFKLVSDVRTGDAFTLTGMISGTGNQTSTQLTETLYPSHANLSFGTDYEITALKIAEMKTVVEETTKFSIPAEPSRIVGLKNTPNVDGNRTEIVVVGRWMDAGDYTVTLSPSASFTITFEGVKSEERESKPTTLWLYGSKVDLSFDVSYTLVSVVKASPGTNEIFIDQPIAPFTIAEKTRLTEMRLESYSLDRKKADFVMTGLLLSTSKIYEVELKSASSSRWIAMKVDGSEWKGEAVLYPSADATLKYGDSYWINSFREQGTTVELLHDTLEVIEIIPEPPRLLSCSAEPATGLNTTILTLTTHALSSGVEYTLTLRGSKLDVNDDTSNNENSDVIIAVEGKATIVLPLTLYPLNDADVEYGMNYSIISLSSKGETQPVLIEQEASSFVTPSLPFRVENASSELTLSRNEVKIVLTGTSFPTPSEPSQAIEATLTGVSLGSPLTVSGEFDANGWISLKCWTETGHSHKLEFGEWYSVSAVSVASLSALVNNHVSFLVPLPPKVTEAWLKVKNSMGTGVRLVVSGEGLALSGDYEAELNNSLSFPIVFHSAASGASPTLLPIGGNNPLQFGQTYEITKISKSDNPDDLVLSPNVIIDPLKAPTEIELFSDSSSSDESFLCGEKTNPCHSMDAAWRIADSIGAKEIDIKLLNTSRLSTVMKVGKDCLLAFERGGFAEPRLEIGADVSHEKEKGLIVVDEGRFELRDVDVSIRPSSSDFVFLCVSDGVVVMKDSAIIGSSKSDTTDTLSNDDTVCWWSSGVFVLNNSHTSIHSTEFSFIPQGVFQQFGGILTIETSAFHDNTPLSQSSPSARRNIACSENGKVEIQTLNGGDGFRGSSGWISADECEVSGTDSTPNSPLFIPTLDTANSTVTLNKKTGSFLFSLSGSQLIECGLSVELYEINEKTNVTGQNISLPLSSLSPSPNNESSLVFNLTAKELSKSLSESMEWRMDLGFGKDQHTKWLLVQKSKQGKMAQSFGEALPWLIPVIVTSVVVLFLLLILLICLRRRQKAKQKKQPLTTQELDEDPFEMKDDIIDTAHPSSVGILRNNTAECKLLNEEKSSNPTFAANSTREPIRPMVRVMECQGEYAARTVVKTETLYDRLHRTKQPNWNTDRLRMIQQLVRGLAVARQSNMTDQILTELSPHKIVVNDSDEVFLLMTETGPTYSKSYQPVFVASQNENGQVAQEGETEQKNNIVEQNQTQQIPTHTPHSAEPETEPAAVEQSSHEGNQLAQLPRNDVFFRLPQSFVTDDGRSTLTSSSVMMKANENVRWTPPEVTGRKSGVDKEKAAVFSLGLILWEIETGEVPFGELDAMNAHRQIGVGGEMLMRKVCSETASLVRQCISLDPVTRPTLEQVASTLGFSLTTQTTKKGQSQQNEAIGV